MTDLETVLSRCARETDRVLAFLYLEEYYRLADDAERDAIRAGWPFGQRWGIPGLDYSDWDHIVFEPLVGVDKHGLDAEARLETRLTYHAIEDARIDFRDTGLDLCLCSHAGLAAGVDMARLFQEASLIAGPYVGQRLRGWRKGPAENCSLWAMGFRGRESENKIVFDWIGDDPDYDDLKPKRVDEWGREIAG